MFNCPNRCELSLVNFFIAVEMVRKESVNALLVFVMFEIWSEICKVLCPSVSSFVYTFAISSVEASEKTDPQKPPHDLLTRCLLLVSMNLRGGDVGGTGLLAELGRARTVPGEIVCFENMDRVIWVGLTEMGSM